jgi:hypothetical protein
VLLVAAPARADDDEEADPLKQGLVVHWPLDGDARDAAPGHLDGLMCGPTATEGHSGPGSVALEFDGVDDYVDLAAAMPAVGSLGQGTISVWFRVDQAPDQWGNRPNPRANPPFPGVPQVDQVWFPVLYLGAVDPVNGNNSLMVYPVHPNFQATAFYTIVRDMLPADPVIGRPATRPFFCFDSCDTTYAGCDGPGDDAIVAGQWYHFAIVVDGSGNRGYLNGVELVNRRFNPGRSQFPTIPAGPGFPSEDSDTEFFDDVLVAESFKLGAGVWGYAVHEKFMDGAIDDVRIYDRPLTAAEVVALYQSADPSAGESWAHLKYETCTGEDYWWKDAPYPDQEDADWRWANGWGAWWDQACVDEAGQGDDWWDQHWW